MDKKKNIGKSIIFFGSLTVVAIGFALVWWFHLSQVSGSSNKNDGAFLANKASFDRVEDLDLNIAGIEVDSDGQKDIPSKGLAAKMAKELELNKYAVSQEVIISSENIYTRLIERGATIDKELAERMKTSTLKDDDWRDISMLISDFLSADESFKVELSQYSNFKELKRAVDERSKVTGRHYGNELLAQESTYKDATIGDILEVLNAGAVLPEDAVLLALRSNNIALISELQKAGYAVDVDYVDKYQSQNALEAYVASNSIYDDGMAIETIEQLLQLGVPLRVEDGTRDPLDYVLTNITAENASSRFAVAKKLMAAGLSLDVSHKELLDRLKIDSPELYEKFIE